VQSETENKAPENAVGNVPAPAARPAAAGAAKAAAKPRRRFGIALYHAWCKRCGICGEFCPTKAIVNDDLGAPMVVDESKCVGCMQCMHRCPDFCVEVYEKAAAPEQKDRTASKPEPAPASDKSEE